MALEEAYDKDRSLLSKVLYGDPIAIGYIKVSLNYELKGCWRLRLEILTNEQFHLSSDKIHALIDGPTTPVSKLSSHAFLQIWSSANKEEKSGALKLLSRDGRSIKRGAEIDPRNPFIGIYLNLCPQTVKLLQMGRQDRSRLPGLENLPDLVSGSSVSSLTFLIQRWLPYWGRRRPLDPQNPTHYHKVH